MMNGEVEATTLTEPYITLAEKAGCRIIQEALYHGTEVVSDAIGAETYAAFNRAVVEAVRRINAAKRKRLLQRPRMLRVDLFTVTFEPKIQQSAESMPALRRVLLGDIQQGWYQSNVEQPNRRWISNLKT